MVPGYDYENTAEDPVLARVVSSYEAIEWYPPPVEIVEDFDTGAGPFWTYEDETSSVQAIDGVLRIKNNHPEWAAGTGAEFDRVSDAVMFTVTVKVDHPLGEAEGPSLAIVRDLFSDYEFAVIGSTAYLVENLSEQDYRLLDSAAMPVPVTEPFEMSLYARCKGEEAGVAAFINGEPLLFSDSCTGTFEGATLWVYAQGPLITVDFDDLVVWAQAAGEPLPDLFATVKEHTVLVDGEPVATLAVLGPSDYLLEFPALSDPQSVPKMLVEFPPAEVEVSTDTIGGVIVVTGEFKGHTFWVWTSGEAWSVISAQDAGAGRAFAEAYFAQELADAGATADEA